MEKRKSGEDYQNELSVLRNSLKSLEAHIGARLVKLSTMFPQAVIVKKRVDIFRAKDMTKSWIDGLDTDTKIKYIRNIEDWLKEQEQYKQGTMEF